MDDQSLAYFEQRERAERAAAKLSANARARAAHQELAQHYAGLALGKVQLSRSDPPVAGSRLTILTRSSR